MASLNYLHPYSPPSLAYIFERLKGFKREFCRTSAAVGPFNDVTSLKKCLHVLDFSSNHFQLSIFPYSFLLLSLFSSQILFICFTYFFKYLIYHNFINLNEFRARFGILRLYQWTLFM